VQLNFSDNNLKKTEQGFILNRISFSETSIIVKIFTKNHGLKSFMVKGGAKKFSSIFQALTYIEFTYYQKNEDQLANLYEPVLVKNFQEIYFDPIKQSVVFFETEFLKQCLHENQADIALFDFILNELEFLNQHSFNPNYLIHWILDLAFLFGIQPQLIDEGARYFDLINGELTIHNSMHSESLKGDIILKFAKFLNYNVEKQMEIHLTKDERKQLLEILLRYFSLHIDTFKKINSFEIYQTLWYA
jgi:DNA repair protein RecO (recombination protein O)